MVQPYLEQLPISASTPVLAALVTCALAGAVLWIVGARFSRFLTTLVTVTLGAAIGMQMPRWFGWQISGAGPAVGGAVVLGVTGFALHGMWMGVLLGLGLATWSAFIVWLTAGGAQPIVWPGSTGADQPAMTCAAWLGELWRGLPPGVMKYLPYTTSVALISALAAAILWTRLTTVLAWSVAGSTLVLGCGLAALRIATPHLLDGQVPQLWVQIAGLGVMVGIGASLQWKFAPKSVKGSKPPPGGGKPSGKPPKAGSG